MGGATAVSLFLCDTLVLQRHSSATGDCCRWPAVWSTLTRTLSSRQREATPSLGQYDGLWDEQTCLAQYLRLATSAAFALPYGGVTKPKVRHDTLITASAVNLLFRAQIRSRSCSPRRRSGRVAASTAPADGKAGDSLRHWRAKREWETAANDFGSADGRWPVSENGERYACHGV